MNMLEIIDKEGLREGLTQFSVGDTVSVHFKIVEGTKERVQVYEGLVIARKNGGIRETFTVRKISFGVGVERTFPLHSPRIEKIEVIRFGDVRRAKLYYIRDLTGKAATRVKEKKHVPGSAKSTSKTASKVAKTGTASAKSGTSSAKNAPVVNEIKDEKIEEKIIAPVAEVATENKE